MKSVFGNVTFGAVRLSGNSNLKVNGDNNQGSISNNSNLTVMANNANLELSNNNNLKITTENSTLKTENCSNTAVSGNGYEAILKENSNGKFNGNNGKWEAFSNSNIFLCANDSVVKMIHNSNAKVEGNKGKVTAEDNSNLRVTGDGNNVNVKGTRNHTLTPAQTKQNLVEIIPNPNGTSTTTRSTSSGTNFISSVSTWVGGVSGSHINLPSYKINYVDGAFINKEKYQLGIYNFNMTYNEGENNHKIAVDQEGLDPSSLVLRVVGENEALFSATKAGEKQELKVKGPHVVEKDPTVIIISML